MPADRRSRIARSLPLALLVLVLAFGVLERHEIRKIPTLVQNAEPAWLLLVLALQAGTYFAVGFVYRTLAHPLRVPLEWSDAARLSVVNLFVNAAVPTAGLSGNFFLVRMLSKRGVPAGAGAVVVLLERAIYFAALTGFALLVIGALLLRGRLHGIDVFAVAALAAIVVGISLLVRVTLRDPHRVADRVARWSGRAPRFLRTRFPREMLDASARQIEAAGGAHAFPPARLAFASLGEVALLAFDSLTVWALFRSIGVAMPVVNAAMGFALATLLSQIVVVPGALEVSLAGVLAGLGARFGNAVAVTLLFHAAAFWLPLPAGWWFYRRAEAKPGARPGTGYSSYGFRRDEGRGKL